MGKFWNHVATKIYYSQSKTAFLIEVSMAKGEGQTSWTMVLKTYAFLILLWGESKGNMERNGLKCGGSFENI